MIAGTRSGAGKTTITCGILQMLVNRGIQVASLKCGPDYIDPMFHEKVLGVRSGNLDGFFMEEATLSSLLEKHSRDKDITVLEGVMGYYDGIGTSNIGSSYQVSMATNTPVILVLDCYGMGSLSIGAMLHGFVSFQENQIQGVLFNQLPAQLYEDMKALAEGMGIRPCGYVPTITEFQLESRHLGLVTADEVVNIKEKLRKLAEKLEESVELDAIIELAGQSDCLEVEEELATQGEFLDMEEDARNRNQEKTKETLRIAVAKDEAFCFIYQDNIELLQELGCDIVYFSPLHDEKLPENIQGLLLYGGYPELYAKALSENESMKQSIREANSMGIPMIAECGGFMYLHETMEDIHQMVYPMVGVIPGKSFKTNRLKRFGYVTIEATKDTLLARKGDRIKAHEFHFWDSENNGKDFVAYKPQSEASWECVHANERFYAGYPHVHFYTDVKVARRFVEKCREKK